MTITENNYAFIDAQNVNLGVRALGWKLDWRRFRTHLRDTYGVTTAYQFIGFIPEHQQMYQALQQYGYVVVHKPVTYRSDGKAKGNVDAELVLQAMIDFDDYERAVLVTSDGDFACLVRHLRGKDKLRAVISPNLKGCSSLLQKATRGQIDTLDGLRTKLEYKK